MTRLPIPTAADLGAEPQLASLLFLELAIALAAGALRAAHPAVEGDFHPGESGEITTGRILLNECGLLREDLDDYRRRVIARLRRQQSDWPF
jgi:hypothetical protein